GSAYARAPQGRLLLRVQEAALFDRFPLRDRPASARWRAAAERIAAHGAGCALFVELDESSSAAVDSAAARVAADPDLVWLLAQHVDGRSAHLLTDERETSAAEVALAAALREQGVMVDALPL